MSKNLILVSDDPSDREFAAATAEAGGLTLLSFKTLREALEEGAKEAFAVLLQMPTEPDSSLARTLQENLAQVRVTGIVPPDNSEVIASCFRNGGIGHTVIRRYDDPAANGRAYSRVLSTIDSSQELTLTSFVHPEAIVSSIPINKVYDKFLVTKAVFHELRGMNCPERVANTVSTAVDELMMNALYDAPVDAEGKRAFSDAMLDEQTRLSGKSAVEVLVAVDEHFAAATIVDQMGSLDRARLLDHLAQRGSDADKINARKDTTPGSGIGLLRLLRVGGSLCFSSKPGIRTASTTLFRLDSSYAKFRQQFQFVATQVG